MALGMNVLLRNARANQITTFRDAAVGASKYRIYDGVQPATGGTPTNLLAEATFGDPSSAAAAAGVLTANAITGDASANATGTATWARELDGDDNFVQDMTAGEGSEDLVLNSADITAGLPVEINSNVITEGNA